MKILILLALVAAATASPVLKSPQDACSSCQKDVNTIYEFVSNPAMQDEIIALMQEACSYFGAEAAICKTLVQTYGKELIQVIVSELSNSTKVCQELGLCSSSRKQIYAALFKKVVLSPRIISLVQSHHAKVSGKAPQDECATCQEVVNTIYEYINNPQIENELISLIEQVCTYFGAEAQICKSLVETYGKEILQYIINEFSNATKVCTEIGLCTGSKQKVMALLIQKATPIHHLKTPRKHVLKATYPVKASTKCVLCEFVAKELDSMLTKNATEQEITAALEKVCSILPSTVKTECDDLVKEYGPAIIQILAQELNPETLCTAIGLCASKEHRLAMMKPHKLVIGSQETCEICTVVITYLKSLLKNNATEEEIIGVLEKGCNYLPSQLSSECNAIVSEYGKMVLDMIANEDAKALCTEMTLCSAKYTMLMKAKPVAKQHKCELGASYWCASPKNAVACKAVVFCRKYAWH